LSSSAALNCGLLYGIGELFGLGLSDLQVITMTQESEHLIGLNCGIMDQFAVMHGKKDCFLELDCRDLSYELYSSDFAGHSIVLLDTRVKHKLTDSAYNKRRQECEEVLEAVKVIDSQVSSVRDISSCHLEKIKDNANPTSWKRVEFVLKENQRVIDATTALVNGDYQMLGRLLLESHEGLSKNYEVSCEESDFLVQVAREDENVMGARQMGGGFGGCIITIIKKGFDENFIEKAFKAYKEKLGIELMVHHIKIGDGLKII
jgi:galactokinase